MLTLGTRIKIVAFIMIALAVVGHVSVRYADLGRYIGMRGYYTVRLDLPTTGGLFEGSAVSYRGVTVGEVGGLDLSDDGVIAELHIEDSAPEIPKNLEAVVANRSAVGEQYVDLRPRTASGPYLAQGATIPRSATAIPAPVNETLKSVNDLAGSLPLNDVEVLIDELGLAFAGQGPHLQQLLDTSARFVSASDRAFPDTRALIHNGGDVLRTQNELSGAFKSFSSNTRLLARQLRDSDADLRDIIESGPGAAAELSRLLRDLDPHLSVLLANFLTMARLGEPRQAAIEELLVRLPQIAGMVSTIVSGGKLRVSFVNTFFNPQPCTRGYGGTRYRKGLDLSSAPSWNSEARCTEDPSTGINVRGSAHAPRKGVPEPARPGSLSRTELTDIFRTFGLPAAAADPDRALPTDLRGLLGLEGTR